MRYKDWSSTPAFFSQHKRTGMVACFFVGLIVLCISLYVLATEMYFFHGATAVEAVIIEVRHEYVAAGRGSVLAYVPVVEIPNRGDRISVDTSSEDNVYSIGTRMSVLCVLSVSRRCIRNTFLDTWGDGIIDLIIALLFLLPSLLYFRRLKQESQAASTPNPPTT
ncbi:MAG TPA: hypothetical protein DC054_04745 [Blastocatellia bacterium]|nr:hypothetical protein [Blastocatellia bacterium]